MEIRATERADIPAIDALLARSYPVLLKPDYPPSVLVTALPIISRAQPGLVTCGSYFGVFVSGDLVSAGGWTRARPGGGEASGTVGHIRHVVTDPERVRQGYGHALMQHALHDARTAVAFYQACGFAIVEEIVVSLCPGIGFPAIRMQSFL